MKLSSFIGFSLAGHLAILATALTATSFRCAPGPSAEILHLSNVMMIPAAGPGAPETPPSGPAVQEAPAPEPPPAPQPETPPPPPPEPEPVAVRPPPPPPPPAATPPREERTISREPDRDLARLQREELERLREEQRRRDQAEAEERARQAERDRQAEEARRLAQAQQNVPPPPPAATGAGTGTGVQVEQGGGGSQIGYFAYQLVNFIGRNWTTRRQWASQDLSVRVALTIQRDGTFSDIQIITPSGNEQFDQAAYAALRDNPQGPPLPDFITGDSVQVTVRLVSR